MFAFSAPTFHVIYNLASEESHVCGFSYEKEQNTRIREASVLTLLSLRVHKTFCSRSNDSGADRMHV